MKKKKLVLLLFSFLFLNSSFAETIHLMAGNWPPYLSPKMDKNGIAGKIVTEALEMKGHKVEIHFAHWQEGMAWGKKGRTPKGGKVHGTLLWFKTPEREKDFYFSDPLIHEKHVFFHRKESPVIFNKLSDLSRLRIGAIIGFHYGKEFEEAERRGRIRVGRTYLSEFAFAYLVHKKIDLFPQEMLVGYHQLKEYFPKKLQRMVTHHEKKPLYEGWSHLLLSKKHSQNQKLMNDFNEGFKKLKEQGKVKAYLNEVTDPRKDLYKNSLKGLRFLKKWKK